MPEASHAANPSGAPCLIAAAVATAVDDAETADVKDGRWVVVAAHVAGTVTELVVVPLAPVAVTVAVPKGFPSESQYTRKMIPWPGAGGAGGITVAVGVGAAVTVTGGGGTVVVVGSIKLPVIVGTAYGGSKRPNRPQALHGYAHDRTWLGAARMGSQRASTMVAMAVGSAVCGQSVPRSARVSWRVMLVPAAMVETSQRSKGSIQFVVAGPAGSPRVLVPIAVGINIYTDGEVKV